MDCILNNSIILNSIILLLCMTLFLERYGEEFRSELLWNIFYYNKILYFVVIKIFFYSLRDVLLQENVLLQLL